MADFRVRPPVAGLMLLVAAALGIAAGAGAAAVAGRFSASSASYAARFDLREAPEIGAFGLRARVISSLGANAPERFSPVAGAEVARGAPRLIVIIDDMGLDRAAFERIIALPGPMTLSFLPYANGVQPMVDRANAAGFDVMLHLPMEPSGVADAGPHHLTVNATANELFDALAWNLDRFHGYRGVNNHMGSRFTRDEQAMKRVLAALDTRGLYFVDSLTTGSSMASKAGAAVGADVLVRDVFLDAQPGADFIRGQIALAEEIAQKTGYAIVICHPRKETLDVVGPWLTTATARGFELTTISQSKNSAGRKLAGAY